MDSSILITTEKKLINTEHAKMFELIGIGMAIKNATLDRERKDEEWHKRARFSTKKINITIQKRCNNFL